MSELKLISSRQLPLKPLVESALSNELRLLDIGIRRSNAKLNDFEKKYGISTKEFIQKYNYMHPRSLDPYLFCL